MKRILLAAVTFSVLALGSLLPSTANAHGPHHYHYRPSVGLYGGYGLYNGGYAPYSAYYPGYVPYGAGYVGGYQPYQSLYVRPQPRIGLYFGF